MSVTVETPVDVDKWLNILLQSWPAATAKQITLCSLQLSALTLVTLHPVQVSAVPSGHPSPTLYKVWWWS